MPWPRGLHPDRPIGMTPEDFDQLEAAAPHLRDMGSCGLLSPLPLRRRRAPWSVDLLSELRLFPDATAIDRAAWDLSDSSSDRFEVLVAANVFMYAPDPQRWLRNVLAACRYFLIVDLVRRRRRPDSEFGPDGDCQRYAIGQERPRVERHLDLNTLGERLLGFRTYPGGASPFDAAPIHFIALIRGGHDPGHRNAASVSDLVERLRVGDG